MTCRRGSVVPDQFDEAFWDVVVADTRPRPASDSDSHEITIHDAVPRDRKRP